MKHEAKAPGKPPKPAPSGSLDSNAEMLQALVNSVQDYAVMLLDPGGKVLTWNAGAERLKGWKAEEMVGQHFSRFYSPEEIANGKPELELKTAGEVGRFEVEGWRMRGGRTVIAGMQPPVAVAATEIGLNLGRIERALNVDRALDVLGQAR